MLYNGNAMNEMVLTPTPDKRKSPEQEALDVYQDNYRFVMSLALPRMVERGIVSAMETSVLKGTLHRLHEEQRNAIRELRLPLPAADTFTVGDWLKVWEPFERKCVEYFR